MLSQDLGAIRQSAERLHELIPGVDIDRYCVGRHWLMMLQQMLRTCMMHAPSYLLAVYRLGYYDLFITCCRLVEEHPTLLDVQAFETAISDAKHVIPGLDVSHMMRSFRVL